MATAAFGILSFAIWPEFWSLYDFMFTLMGVLVIGTPLVLAAFCFWHARELKKQQGEIAYPEK